MTIFCSTASEDISEDLGLWKSRDDLQNDYWELSDLKSLSVRLKSFPLRNLSEVNWDTCEITSTWL